MGRFVSRGRLSPEGGASCPNIVARLLCPDAPSPPPPPPPLFLVSYIFGESNEFWDDLEANGVTPRRLFLYNLLGAGVVLGGNLFGVTSDLLGFAPESSRNARLDVIFPVRGFKR